MKYAQKTNVGGSWVKATELQSGMDAYLTSETKPITSVFEGKEKVQDVAKIKIKGFDEEKNIALNKTTINGLIAAFGDDSVNWVNKPLKVVTEKVMVGGRRVTAVYLLSNGFELKEDSKGYLVITKSGTKAEDVESSDIKAEDLPF